MEQIAGNQKYIKRADLEKQRQEAYLKEKQEKERIKQEKQLQKDQEFLQKATAKALKNTQPKTLFDLSKMPEEDIIRRFRTRNEPIRLFGESNEQRLSRLGKLEAHKEDSSHGQKNDFRLLLEATEDEIAVQKHYGISLKKDSEVLKNQKIKDVDNKELDPLLINKSLLETNPELLYTLVAVYFKRLLREWEKNLFNRIDNEKQSQEVFLFS